MDKNNPLDADISPESDSGTAISETLPTGALPTGALPTGALPTGALPTENAVAEPDEEEIVVTLGDTPAPPAESDESAAPAPVWVKELRKNYRDLQKRNRELAAKLTAPQQTQQAPVLGKKPELADVEYDTDKYESELLKWADQKKQIETIAHEAEAKARKQQEAWSARLQAYETAKTALKVVDIDAAEAAVQAAFDVTQQGLIIKSADNPALVIHALGTHPKELKELAAITDPVLFVKALTKLELSMKVHKRNKPPAPESTAVRGNGRVSGAVDPTLDRLRADAMRTGDTSKVVAYKRQLKQRSK